MFKKKYENEFNRLDALKHVDDVDVEEDQEELAYKSDYESRFKLSEGMNSGKTTKTSQLEQSQDPESSLYTNNLLQSWGDSKKYKNGHSQNGSSSKTDGLHEGSGVKTSSFTSKLDEYCGESE